MYISNVSCGCGDGKPKPPIEYDCPVVELLLDPNARIIPLTRGKYAIVDREDYQWASQRKWCCGSNGYPRADRNMYLHKLITGTEGSNEIDHANGNKLDNRRNNLRRCNHSQNMWNTKVTRENKLGVKGIWWNPEQSRFHSQLRVNGKRIWVGYFLTLEEAKKAYAEAVRRLRGEFGRT